MAGRRIRNHFDTMEKNVVHQYIVLRQYILTYVHELIPTKTSMPYKHHSRWLCGIVHTDDGMHSQQLHPLLQASELTHGGLGSPKDVREQPRHAIADFKNTVAMETKFFY